MKLRVLVIPLFFIALFYFGYTVGQKDLPVCTTEQLTLKPTDMMKDTGLPMLSDGRVK